MYEKVHGKGIHSAPEWGIRIYVNVLNRWNWVWNNCYEEWVRALTRQPCGPCRPWLLIVITVLVKIQKLWLFLLNSGFLLKIRTISYSLTSADNIMSGLYIMIYNYLLYDKMLTHVIRGKQSLLTLIHGYQQINKLPGFLTVLCPQTLIL